MNILQRYIAKSIITSTLLVVLVVLALSFFINLLGELNDIGNGDYGFGQAVIHVLLLLPHTLYQFFPMVILLGGVIGLGALASYHELIVMRTSGVSIYQVVLYALSAALLFVVIAALLGELIAPHADYLADKRKNIAENRGQAVVTSRGVWLHEGNNFLHIDRVMGHHHLEGVTRYQFDNAHHLLASYQAKTMDFTDGKWVLYDLGKTLINHDRTTTQHFAKTTWDLNINPTLVNIGLTEPEEMTLTHLQQYSQHLVKNGLMATNFQFEFWKRVFQPLASLIMVLLAIPFVFGSPRAKNMSFRILFGLMLGFGFYILDAFLGQVSVVYQISPFFAATLPIALFALIGYGFILRQERF